MHPQRLLPSSRYLDILNRFALWCGVSAERPIWSTSGANFYSWRSHLPSSAYVQESKMQLSSSSTICPRYLRCWQRSIFVSSVCWDGVLVGERVFFFVGSLRSFEVTDSNSTASLAGSLDSTTKKNRSPLMSSPRVRCLLRIGWLMLKSVGCRDIDPLAVGHPLALCKSSPVCSLG